MPSLEIMVKAWVWEDIDDLPTQSQREERSCITTEREKFIIDEKIDSIFCNAIKRKEGFV